MEDAAAFFFPLRAESQTVPKDKCATIEHRCECRIVRRQLTSTPLPLRSWCRRWLLRLRQQGLVWLCEDHVDSDTRSAEGFDLFQEPRDLAPRPGPAAKSRKTPLVEVDDHH